MNLSEIGKKITGQRYLKMYLVRDGRVIKTLIREITESGWLLDKSLKMAWMIPPEGKLIIEGKASIFFGSLEAIHTLEYEYLYEHLELKDIFEWKEGRNISIPYLKPKITKDTWSIEKGKFILSKDEKYDFVSKIGKSYTPFLPSLDLNAVYNAMSGKAIALVMKPPEDKEHFDTKTIMWIIVGLGLVLAFIYLRGGF